MHWAVAAPFFHPDQNVQWLFPFVPGAEHTFSTIPNIQGNSPQRWHNRNSRMTSWYEWQAYWRQARQAWSHSADGVITVFPQLAASVGLLKRFSRKDKPIVAWCFNLGACYPGWRQWFSKMALNTIDTFIVHSRAEILNYSKWLGISPDRFKFVPLQTGVIDVLENENVENPFLLSMGTARRDYPVLLRAVEKLGIRTILVAGRHALAGIHVPAHVEVRSGLSRQECLLLAQQARINVVPISNIETASGQVTIVEAMRMGRPVIATRSIGSEDYIEHGKTGFLVEHGNVCEMTASIKLLWNDLELRNFIANNAKQYAQLLFSDTAAGVALGKVLDKTLNKKR